jgi:hypothetical protein
MISTHNFLTGLHVREAVDYRTPSAVDARNSFGIRLRPTVILGNVSGSAGRMLPTLKDQSWIKTAPRANGRFWEVALQHFKQRPAAALDRY